MIKQPFLGIAMPFLHNEMSRKNYQRQAYSYMAQYIRYLGTNVLAFSSQLWAK